MPVSENLWIDPKNNCFDAGFETDNIGTFMMLNHPINIEVGARVAQMYNHVSDPVENLYNGQFQKDAQSFLNLVKHSF